MRLPIFPIKKLVFLKYSKSKIFLSRIGTSHNTVREALAGNRGNLLASSPFLTEMDPRWARLKCPCAAICLRFATFTHW